MIEIDLIEATDNFFNLKKVSKLEKLNQYKNYHLFHYHIRTVHYTAKQMNNDKKRVRYPNAHAWNESLSVSNWKKESIKIIIPWLPIWSRNEMSLQEV